MMIGRRGVLQLLGVLAADLACDPERRIWVAGRKKIFVPPAPRPDLTVATIQDAILALERGGVAYMLQPRYILVVNPDGRHDRMGQLFERAHHPELGVGVKAIRL